MTHDRSVRTTIRRTSRIGVAGLLAVIAAVVAFGHWSPSSSTSGAASPPADVLHTAHRLARGEARLKAASPAHRHAVPSNVWPAEGQAAFVQTGESQIHAGPNQHPASIASVAKVMAAYVVLRDHPLGPVGVGHIGSRGGNRSCRSQPESS